MRLTPPARSDGVFRSSHRSVPGVKSLTRFMRRCATIGSVNPVGSSPSASSLCRCWNNPYSPLVPLHRRTSVGTVRPLSPAIRVFLGHTAVALCWHPRPTVSHTPGRPFPGSSPVLFLTVCAARPSWVDRKDLPLAPDARGASPRPHLSYAS